MQVKGLVVEDMEPIFYTLKFKLSEIPENRILILNNTDWLNTVLAYRKKVPEFSSLDIAKNAVQNLQKYDVVIGPIGDDKTFENKKVQNFPNIIIKTEGDLENDSR